MGELRRPFLILALLVALLVVLLETGSGLMVGGRDATAMLTSTTDQLHGAHGVTQPSGRGIGHLALIDVVVLYTVGLFVLSLLLSPRVQGRVQGVATLIGSIVLIIVALLRLLVAFVELTVMVSLFLAAPFGTLAYLVIWGFFPVGDAATLLGLLLFLKLVLAGLLLLAQPRFVQNKGLVAMLVTTLLCTVVLAFLQGFVPVILVSIVDDIAAVVFAVVAIVWGLVLLIGSLPAIWKAIRATAG